MTFDSYTLGEVCSFIDYRGKTPKKATTGIPLITAKIVKNGFISKPDEFIAEEDYDSWMHRGIPRKGSVIMTTEAPLGEVARIPSDDRLAFAQRIIVLEPRQEILDAGFLYYALRDSVLMGRIKSRATGTTVTGIKAAELKKVEIDCPPIETQKRVASLLSSLDQRIENNESINDNLLQQLQAIYQQIFDSASRNDGVLSDICSYSQRRVAVASLTLESYYSTENMLPEKAGAVSASSLPTIVQTTGCAPGDVLISNIRPYFKKIVYCRSECGCSTDVLCFVPMEPCLSPFLFSTLYDDRFFDYMVAGSKGTKMPRGDKQQIMAYPVVKPSNTQLERFNALGEPILAKIESSNQENKRLSAIRDALLPKLMSGEIDVSSITL
jgi:hypothetical protein